jgi:hypothetical protein
MLLVKKPIFRGIHPLVKPKEGVDMKISTKADGLLVPSIEKLLFRT